MDIIKHIIILLSLGMSICQIRAQNVVHTTNELVINTGSYMVVVGDFENKGSGTVTVNGTLSVTGDITEETGSSTSWGGSSSMLINGGGTQNITGISSIDGLTLENNSQAVLAQNTAITGSLTLTSGNVSVGNFNLTIGNSASISGASASNYVITNGTGALVRQVGGSAVSFPVGTSSGYNPISLSNSGSADDLSVSISDNVLLDGSSGTSVSSRVVDRTWNISESVSGSLNLSATFQWDATDELSSFDRNNAVVYHYTGGDWIADGSTGAVSGSDPYTVTVTGITSLSPFSVGDDMTVFPVEFISFSAVQDKAAIRLDWATARELHSDYFAVEHKISTGNWKELGTVAAAGYSQEIQSYSYVDTRASEGTNYYRLRQVDLDGKFAYSDLVEVHMEAADLVYFPNPASDQLNIKNRGTTSLYVKILDLTGKEVSAFEVGTGTSTVDVSPLPAGMYRMQIKKRNGWRKIVPFMKR